MWSFFNRIVSGPFASSCQLCNQPHPTGHPLCRGCLEDLTPNLSCCDCCAEPLNTITSKNPHEIHLCGNCIKGKPHFDKIYTNFIYKFPLDSLITQCKYDSAEHHLATLKFLANRAFQSYLEPQNRPDIVIPVPIDPKKLRKRGFNLPSLIARTCCRNAGLHLEDTLLHRQEHCASQASLSARERRRNLKGQFRWASPDAPRKIVNKHVLILDDVVTTGATADMIAALLKQAGARRVDIFALARTPSYQDDP